MRPAQPKKTAKVVRPPASDASPMPFAGGHFAEGPFAERPPLRPIGPAALKRLREAIRSGRYPSDAAVQSGIERLLRRSE